MKNTPESVGTIVLEGVEFDAGLDENAGGSGIWRDPSPVVDHGTDPGGAWYFVVGTADDRLWRITVEAVDG